MPARRQNGPHRGLSVAEHCTPLAQLRPKSPKAMQLVLVPFGIAAELAAASSRAGPELDIVLLEERAT